MPNNTYKVVEIVGSSPVSISEAINNAVHKASKSLRQLGWFEVVNQLGNQPLEAVRTAFLASLRQQIIESNVGGGPGMQRYAGRGYTFSRSASNHIT